MKIDIGIKENKGRQSAMNMIKLLVEGHEAVSKTAWMLRSLLEK